MSAGPNTLPISIAILLFFLDYLHALKDIGLQGHRQIHRVSNVVP